MNPYLLLRLRAVGVNTQQNCFVSGIPSLPGIAGFVHNLERRTGHAAIDFLPIVHHLDHDAGHAKFRPLSGDNLRSYSQIKNPSTLDISTASASLTLVLRLRDVTTDLGKVKDIGQFCTNFCGGRIVDEPGVSFAATDHDLMTNLRKLPAGWVVRDRRDVFLNSADPVETLIAAVQRNKNTTKTRTPKKEKKTYLVPLHIGYLLIEEPRERLYMLRNPNDGYRHALAEPITGLAEFGFLHSEIRSDTAFEGCWWSYAAAKPGDRVLQIISNRPAV